MFILLAFSDSFASSISKEDSSKILYYLQVIFKRTRHR